MLYNVGAIIGYLVSGYIADGLGRRPLVAIIFIGSLLITPITYLWPFGIQSFLVVVLVNGAFTLGGFAWFAIYLPELFGSTVRATATGFVLNATRLIPWIGPIVSGQLIATFGGVSRAAVYMDLAYRPSSPCPRWRWWGGDTPWSGDGCVGKGRRAGGARANSFHVLGPHASHRPARRRA